MSILRLTQVPDDYSQDRHTAGAVRAGESVTGRIDTGGDVDWIKVRLQAGKTYRIDLEGAASRAGSLSDPNLVGVYDNRSRLLPDTGDDDSGTGFNSRLFLTPEHYGDYYIAVGARFNRTGDYKLLVEEVGEDDYPDGRSGRLAIGTPVTGEIELPGDRDSFEVRLEAGRTYHIGIDAASAVHRTPGVRLLALRDADGRPVSGITRDGNSALFANVAADGVYQVEVAGASDNAPNTGRYALSVRDVTRVDDHTPASAGSVPLGGAVSGAIEKPGDGDWFAFTLEAGALYQVDVRGRDGDGGTLADPFVLGLYEASGNGGPGSRVADSGDNDSGPGQDSLVLFRAPDAGAWYLAVASGLAGGAGTYTVSVTEIHQAGADAGTAGTVQAGGSVKGALDGSAGEAWYAVDLERGVEYRFEVRGNTEGAHGGSLYNPNLTVYDASGEAVYSAVAGDGSGKLGHNAYLEFTAYETGEYFVGIDGGGRTGSYTLYVNSLTDEYPTSILTGGRVAVGGSSAGVIGRPYDRDWLAVELNEGRAYRVDLEGAPTGRGILTDPYLRGIYFNRALLPGTTDDDGGQGFNSRVEFLAPETGAYYIDAGAYSARTGSYRVSVRELTDDVPAAADTAAAVAVGGSATGVVDYGADTDWFAVSMVAGRHYRIHLEGVSTGRGTLDDPRLHGIYDAAGNPVEDAGAADNSGAANNNGAGEIMGADDDSGEGYNSRVDFTAPETATYYIAAGGHAAHTGSYRLSVAEVADDHPATTATSGFVAAGGPVSGEIESPGDADWFVVELVAGEEYRIDLEGWRTSGGSLEDPLLLGIHDAAGDLISGTTDDDGGAGRNSRLDFVAPETGAYYIAAGAYEDHTGTYTLEVDLL